MFNVVVHLSNIAYTGLSEQFEGLSVNAVPKLLVHFMTNDIMNPQVFPYPSIGTDTSRRNMTQIQHLLLNVWGFPSFFRNTRNEFPM